MSPIVAQTIEPWSIPLGLREGEILGVGVGMEVDVGLAVLEANRVRMCVDDVYAVIVEGVMALGPSDAFGVGDGERSLGLTFFAAS